MMITIATFYRFADFADYAQWRAPLTQMMQEKGLRGTILLSPEGLNGTISGSANGVEDIFAHMQADERFAALDIKYSTAPEHPFQREKVKLKESIITMDGKTTPGAACLTGVQCTPEQWNELLDQDDVAVLDTRNTYETYVGTFENAIIWPMRSFSEIVEKVERSFDKKQKIAMFCTGGVRCEKLSSWMLENGYENIYQLEGGIVRYLEQMPAEKSKWQGACYVFDERVAVTHGNRRDEDVTLCPGCDHPLVEKDRQHPAYLPATQCGWCV